MSNPVVKDNVAAVLAAIQGLVSRQVLVGIPSAKAERQNDEPGEPINNAQLGYIHEFGSPQANIPARPFLLPGVEMVEDKVADRLQKAAKAAIKGDSNKVEAELHAAGLAAQAGARFQLNSGEHEALAPSTVAARRRRGRTGDKPLVDTGQLRNSITYVVRDKE